MTKIYLLVYFFITVIYNCYCMETSGKCEEISVPMCRNLQYNMTSMPNQFNHETQHEAAMEAHQFWALVEINCAKELKFFLCSMYTPICLPNYKQPVKACRSVCVRARMGCEQYMKKFGFEWPDHMNCELFPEYGSSKEVCMDPIDAVEQEQRKKLNINLNAKSKTNKKAQSLTIFPKNKKVQQIQQKDLSNFKNLFNNDKTNSLNSYDIINKIGENSLNSNLLIESMCVEPFIKITNINDYRFNRISTGGLKNCLQPCRSIYFDAWQQKFTFYWLTIWSTVCLISSVCTTCTYLIESRRFKYPEKPIIYLSICYLFVSLGYSIRFLTGNESLSCDSDGSVKYDVSINKIGSNSNLSCTFSFILIYYFGMASSVWWVIISLTWFLAAGLKWGIESISKYGFYFHTLAWILPLVKTCIILSFSMIDADSLSGVCYVGNLSTNNLRLFVIIPSLTYLTIGITFLTAGFISLFRIRRLIKQQNGNLIKAQKLEKLMIRIGIFSILYTVPATSVIVCQLYEQHYRNEWEKNALCKNKLNELIESEKVYCESRNSSQDLFGQTNSYNDQPEFSIFILKYFMSLIVGITSGFWIWTSKTVSSWKSFFYTYFACSQHSTASSTVSSKREDGNAENEINIKNNYVYRDDVSPCCFVVSFFKCRTIDDKNKKRLNCLFSSK